MFKNALILLTALAATAAHAQTAMELSQQSMSRWNVGTAQYSGITALGGDRYALVSDKEPTDGFYTFRISQDPKTGQVTAMYLEGFMGNASPKVDAQGISVRDCEGIAWFAPAGTVFISGEGDQEILEYSMKGQPTGRKLDVPAIFSRANIVPNYGFEALTYSAATHRFWTTTESTLPIDGHAASPQHPGVQNLLRLQAFDDQLRPCAQYAYRMDKGRTEDFGKTYVYGVPEMTALPDGRLLVLEREADISNGYLSSYVRCKLFLVNPNEGHQIDSSISLPLLDPNRYLVKQLLCDFTTNYTPFRHTFANYEGMCLGATLADGRRTLLLVSDSQGGYGKGPFHLKDYIKVIVLGE